MVPDWNRVEEVVGKVRDVWVKESEGGKVICSEEDVGFLKKLGMYARKKRRVRIAEGVR